MKKRRGHFTVSGGLLRATPFEELVRIMEGMVVFHVEMSAYTDEVTYFVECADFNLSEEGEASPEYKVVVHHDDEGAFHRREIFLAEIAQS